MLLNPALVELSNPWMSSMPLTHWTMACNSKCRPSPHYFPITSSRIYANILPCRLRWYLCLPSWTPISVPPLPTHCACNNHQWLKASSLAVQCRRLPQSIIFASDAPHHLLCLQLQRIAVGNLISISCAFSSLTLWHCLLYRIHIDDNLLTWCIISSTSDLPMYPSDLIAQPPPLILAQ